MLSVSDCKSMKIMIATPCYISAVSMHYVTSMYGLATDLSHLGITSSLEMHSESLITRGRNKMVLKFLLDPSLTHLFWIDSDISFSLQSFIRLLCADRDVVAGVYPLKIFNWPQEGLPQGMTKDLFEQRYTDYPFNPIGHGTQPVGPYVDADGFVEVDEAPTGFMCIKRQVFLDMMKHYPELNYTPDGPAGHPLAHLHWRFFDCMVDPDSGRYLSEDYAFCRRWRQMGGQIWCDLHSKLDHLGQHLYKGDLAAGLTVQGRM